MKKNAFKYKILIPILLVITSFLVMIFLLWKRGSFLPSYINWEDETLTMKVTTSNNPNPNDNNFEKISVNIHDKTVSAYKNGVLIWTLDSKYKAQSILTADIDLDGSDELLVLCWRIGKYGDVRPFWVDHNDYKWSQHIYIYEARKDTIAPIWMASDIGQNIKSWDIINERFIKNTSPEGNTSIWGWLTWGLTRIPDESFDKAFDEEKRELPDDTSNIPSSDNITPLPIDDDSIEKSDLADTPSASIIMVGDILLHDGVVKACIKESGEYDFSPLFENTKEVISSADVAIVNEEVIIGGKELGVTGYPSFNAPYEIGDALYNAGFNIVCHATNHALDRGKSGILNCLDFWKTNHPDVSIIGIYDSNESYEKVCIKEINGIKIAILNYTYGTNGITLPKDMPYAVKLLNKELISAELKYAEENADFTIVCPHWGVEYKLDASKEQQDMAKFMTENGADLIIGTHPHVIESIEWIEGENGTKSLCYYSLGNFINWTSGKGENIANRMVGGMSFVTIRKEDTVTQIKEYSILPLVSHLEGERGKVTTYFLDDYTDDLAGKNAILKQDQNFSLMYCKTLCNKAWGTLYQ